MNISFKILAHFILASLALSASPAAIAHRSGCHRWHSCPSDTGSYVCGDTGHSNECALTFEQRNTAELGQKLVLQEAENKTLQLNGAETQKRLDTLLEKNQGLELSLAAAKAAATVQESMVTSMLQRLTATIPTPAPE